MHELSVCQSLIGEVERVAAAHGAAAARRIVLCIGPLSGIDMAQLRAAFTVARAGTCAADAELEIEDTPVRVACRECGAESAATVQRLVCGRCGGWRTSLVSGDEILLRTVELQRTSTERNAPCARPAAAP